MAKISTTYKQGDMVLIPYPYTDLSSVKKRPVIIVSSNTHSDFFVVAKVTSAVRNDDFSFPLNNSDLSRSVMKPSEVRINELFTAHKTLIIKHLSKLSHKALIKLNAAIKTNLDVP
jgi:mRNA interferase MazF